MPDFETSVDLDTIHQVLVVEDDIVLQDAIIEASYQLAPRLGIQPTIVISSLWPDFQRNLAIIADAKINPYPTIAAVIVDLEGGLKGIEDIEEELTKVESASDLRIIESRSWSSVAGNLLRLDSEDGMAKLKASSRSAQIARVTTSSIIPIILGKAVHTAIELKRMNGGIRPNIPVVATSGTVLTPDNQAILGRYGITYVQKPYVDMLETYIHCFPEAFAQEIQKYNNLRGR
jgi:hypothetical protein